MRKMYTIYDYRFTVHLSLLIMKRLRQEIYNKCLLTDTNLYMGLHEIDDQLRTLRFQYTVLDWVDSHWWELHNILDAHSEYTVDQKKEITLFFAQYYSKMIDNLELSGTFSKVGTNDLIKMQKQILTELISTGEHWEENSRRLRLEMKKHEEEYNHLIATIETF